MQHHNQRLVRLLKIFVCSSVSVSQKNLESELISGHISYNSLISLNIARKIRCRCNDLLKGSKTTYLMLKLKNLVFWKKYGYLMSARQKV